MQIHRLFSHCYGMPTLAKPVCCTCFHKLSYCNSALCCKLKVWNWAQIHTLGRFYPSSSSGQSTVKLCWCRRRCPPTGRRGTPWELSAQLKAPAFSVFPKMEQQLVEMHNLLPYSQQRQGGVCETLNHQQRKHLSLKEVCSLLRSGSTTSTATNPRWLPATC